MCKSSNSIGDWEIIPLSLAHFFYIYHPIYVCVKVTPGFATRCAKPGLRLDLASHMAGVPLPRAGGPLISNFIMSRPLIGPSLRA
jgi:hypothetical protein